jgi:hypothetical protein
LSAQFNFATPRKIYKTSTAMLQGAGDISVIKVHARLNPRGRQSVAVRRLNCVLPRSAATPRRANGRRAHIRRLRPDGEKRTVASPPHQLARPAQSLIVDDVERKQRPPPPELGVEPLKTCAAFHGGEVNETNRARGLLSDMQPYIASGVRVPPRRSQRAQAPDMSGISRETENRAVSSSYLVELRGFEP